MRRYHSQSGMWFDNDGFMFAEEFGGTHRGHHSEFGFNPFSGDIDLDLGGGLGLDLRTGQIEFDGFDF
jgi:hypothetical protein